ncbi:MAG: hypothetical protein L0027_10240, partial [Candidatus Rokubacteria bacterium]|nr:hypothetical protein [Candidatus Rokubacteria bacterium]
MRFGHAWLGEYVDLPDDPREVGRLLTAAGVPLEGIEGDPRQPATVVYDFDILGNRPDCMNHLGLARELAAFLGTPLRLPDPGLEAGGGPTGERAAIVL